MSRRDAVLLVVLGSTAAQLEVVQLEECSVCGEQAWAQAPSTSGLSHHKAC